MVVTRLYFEITQPGQYTIDVAKELSKFHRRLVRQKQLFTVYGGIYQDSQGSNAYLSTAPHFWVTKRSINRGFKAWKKQISDAMNNVADADSSAPLRSGKWSDFKIHLDPQGTSGAPYLSAKDAAGVDLPAGEWNYTTLTLPRPDIEDLSETGYISQSSDQFEMCITGQHTSSGAGTDINYSRVSLIKSWLESRPLPEEGSVDSPNDQDTVTFNDPLTAMFYTGDADEDEKIIETIQDENDTPPYDLDKLFGSAYSTTASASGADLQMQCLVSPDSNTGVASVAGFQALCGLIRINVTGSVGSNGAALILDIESNGVKF
jgi:hypothetical protein